MAESLYEILGVAKDAKPDVVRKAYRKLARTHHPDVNPGDKKAEERFKSITVAYDVLSDEKKRAAYDEFGDDSLHGNFDVDQARARSQWQQARSRRSASGPSGGGGGDFGFGDFGDLFGGRSRGPARGHDMHAQVEMELRQAIDGAEVSLDVPGHGTVRVRIPPGADTGSSIRLAGKGQPGQRGGAAGDLVIDTVVKPHPRLRRDGLDLYLALPVTIDEAYNGANVEVPTFQGPVVLKVPPRSQTGAKLRLRGKGIQRKDTRGDFYVELDVRMPDKADDKLAEALRTSGDAYAAPVRADLVL